ncbi:MAG TPA: class I tRNA ligase family protein, partial [Chitinophagaceae bacterium]|nr:class I tRNA ligase family protein [Chitinophagaceae bacterium]
RFEARTKAIEQLRAEGLLVKEEDYTTRLGFSQRTNAVVEPRISTQWFVKMKELAGPALKAVVDGDIKIYPGDKFFATYKYWLENVKDWCISRQLWWGQRIPAWYDEDGTCYVAESVEDLYDLHPETRNYKLSQDEDVLDTWFSSWLWPIEVFKGITNPNNEDIQYYYPVSVLVTGQDIIFFWVARMAMAGFEFMKEKPFSNVYFTGMVRDKQGRKMSKSLGNSPVLLELIDKYGADAVRFGIMIASPAGNDLLFDEAALEQGRNFNNKIWNALKLVKMFQEKAASSKPQVASAHHSPLTTHNFAVEWFENRLNEVRAEVDGLMKQFRLSETLKTIYSLIWDDFCSWYLEWIKPGIEQTIDESVYNKTIYFFEELMQLLHPYMPFITEEIYHLLRERKDGDDICVKQFEVIKEADDKTLYMGLRVKNDIKALRDARAKYRIKNFEKIEFWGDVSADQLYLNACYTPNLNPEEIRNILEKQINGIYTQQRLAEALQVKGGVEKLIQNEITVTSSESNFYIYLKKQVDASELREELLKDLEYQNNFLHSVLKKLNNERFVQNAKPEVIELEKKKQADAEARIKTIEESLANLD